MMLFNLMLSKLILPENHPVLLFCEALLTLLVILETHFGKMGLKEERK